MPVTVTAQMQYWTALIVLSDGMEGILVLTLSRQRTKVSRGREVVYLVQGRTRS